MKKCGLSTLKERLVSDSNVLELLLIQKAVPGDCGAWVVDSVTNKLFGFIIAGDPHSCIGYIIPAYKIMEDISSQLGKAPTFFQISPSDLVLPRRQSSDIQSTFANTPNTGLWKYTTRVAGETSSEASPSREEQLKTLSPDADQEEGITISPRFPGSTLLVTHLIFALAFTMITTAYTYSSRSRGVWGNSPLLPPQPQHAIIIIQLLMSLSVRYMLQCFLMCCERLRWILAAGGIQALNFHVLGAPTGFWALVSVIIAKPSGEWRPRTWRLLALFKLLVLHVVLVAAQLIWLFGINPQTVYEPGGRIRDWVSRPGFGGGVGDFVLLQGKPLPFAPWRVFGYLSDATRVTQIEPLHCSTANDLHCATYVLMGYSGLVVPNPDLRLRDGNGETAVIINDIPAYVVEFSSGTRPTALKDPADPWLNCANYTSEIGSSIQVCLGLESAPTLSSRVSAGWDFCLSADNCSEVYDYVNGTDAYNNTVFKTTMDISKANVSMIIDVYNGTVLDVYSIGKRAAYPINQSEFFTAFAAPFNYAPVNVSRILESDYLDSLAAVQSSEPIFLNNTSPAELKAVNDGFLDSLIWSFVSPLPSESPAVHLRGFLSYALTSNSGFYFQPASSSPVRQTYLLNVRSLSLFIYTGLNISVWLVSVAMLFVKRSRVLPNISIFPELTFAAKLRGGDTRALTGFGNIDTGSAIERLRGVVYYVGEDEDRVVLSTEPVNPLRRDAAYQ